MEGRVYNQESFLNNVAKKMNRERIKDVQKPKWVHRPQYEVLKGATQDDLVEVLRKQCEIIHTDFIEIKAQQLDETIKQIIQVNDFSSVICYEDQRFKEIGLSDAMENDWPLEGINTYIWNPELGKQNIDAAENADVGITFSDITLAESGTVVLYSKDNKGRSVSLLPKTFIAIIPKSTLVPRMTQATAAINQQVADGKHIASCIDFITGPSNSADIELQLIVGVHGPIKATYILLENK